MFNQNHQLPDFLIPLKPQERPRRRSWREVQLIVVLAAVALLAVLVLAGVIR